MQVKGVKGGQITLKASVELEVSGTGSLIKIGREGTFLDSDVTGVFCIGGLTRAAFQQKFPIN